MQDYLTVGPVPAEEECEQVGQDYNPTRARKECNAYMAQLRRQFGEPPTGARLRILSNPHEFGAYLEVAVYYDSDIEGALTYAFDIENNSPREWDETARADLGLEVAA